MANNMVVNNLATAAAYTTVLLLHMDGALFSTDFPDATGRHTLTSVGPANVDTGHKKFGTGSMATNLAGKYLTSPASADWSLNTGDWCVEAWIKPTSAPSDTLLVGTANPWFGVGDVGAGGFGIRLGATALAVVANGNVQHTQTVSAWSSSVFTHVAVTREGTTLRMFVDGVLVHTATAGTFPNDTTSTLYIGGNPDHASTSQFFGYIDELRIVKGAAIYTAAFTPPSAAYTP